MTFHLVEKSSFQMELYTFTDLSGCEMKLLSNFDQLCVDKGLHFRFTCFPC